MDERLGDFQRLLSELAIKGPSGSVDLLLRQMDAAAAHLLRLCALPHELDLETLRALAPELNDETAQQRWEEFSKLSMISERDHTLAMHDGPRRHLFGRWLQDSVAEFQAASARLVAHLGAQLAQFRREDAAGQSDRIEYAERNRMFHLLGAERPDGMAEFERLCRLRREQFRLGECETLISLAHEYDSVFDPLEKAVLAYHEGKLAADRQQSSVAEDLYQRVLATDRLPIRLKLKALCRIGMLHHEKRRWLSAINFFRNGLEAANAQPDCDVQIVHLHLNLGSTYRDSGDLARAEEVLQKGIALARSCGQLSSLADGYNSLGTLYLKQNENGRAIAAYEMSLGYLEQVGDNFRRAQVYNNLGNSYANESDWAKTEEFFGRSLEIKRQAGDNSGQAMTLTNLVRVHRSRGQPQLAIKAAERAAALFAEVRDEYNVAVAKRNLGRIYRAMNNRDLARSELIAAADLFTRLNHPSEAESARQEARELEWKTSLPWWVILSIVLFVLFLILIVIALVAT